MGVTAGLSNRARLKISREHVRQIRREAKEEPREADARARKAGNAIRDRAP
jgi:hypothetical protein